MYLNFGFYLYLVENLEFPVRFDKYIKILLPSITQSFIEKGLRNGEIKLNNTKVKSNQRVQNGDGIFIFSYILEKFQNMDIIESTEYIPSKYLLEKLKSSILYEDSNLIVLNKPSGLACQGGSNLIHSIDKLMNFLYDTEIRIAHRLDKDTTGIMLLAKNLKYARLLTGLFKDHKIQKIYNAASQKIEVYDKNILRLQKRLLKGETLELNVKMKSMTIGDQEKIVVDSQDGFESSSKIRLLGVKDNLYFFEVVPFTGRKHQIRVHLEYLGFPILGDKKYNFIKSNRNMCLHASRVIINELKICFNIKPSWLF
jgi:23S rRNA pseudouridine955/2504/2580 synthase